MHKLCECGNSTGKLRVFGSAGIVRVGYICDSCYNVSEPPENAVVTDLTIHDLVWQLRQALEHDPA